MFLLALLLFYLNSAIRSLNSSEARPKGGARSLVSQKTSSRRKCSSSLYFLLCDGQGKRARRASSLASQKYPSYPPKADTLFRGLLLLRRRGTTSPFFLNAENSVTFSFLREGGDKEHYSPSCWLATVKRGNGTVPPMKTLNNKKPGLIRAGLFY